MNQDYVNIHDHFHQYKILDHYQIYNNYFYNTEFVDWECPDGSEPPSWEEVETEIKREVEIYNYYLYERQREKLYPDWKTQMDMLYHDIKNNNLENGSWIQSIDKIKSTYPKPE